MSVTNSAKNKLNEALSKLKSISNLKASHILDIVDVIKQIINNYVDADSEQTLTNKTLTSPIINTGNVTLSKDTVTQTTNIITAVTLNSNSGVISTVVATLVAGNEATFTLKNDKIKTDSVILLQPEYDTGGATGYPIAITGNKIAGSCNIILKNLHASAPLNARVKIHFAIL